MQVAVITGSSGLIGSEAAHRFAQSGLTVVGVDNDLRAHFFGPEASTLARRSELIRDLGDRYRHHDLDVRDQAAIEELFRTYGGSIELVVHAAAQPSHDWAARDPHTDFHVNATGTLNVLEATRRHCPNAVFIYTSTNKVYGDNPNRLPLSEGEKRWDLAPDHDYFRGVPEDFPLDHCLHSLFGASKLSADIMVQEYGRYFGMRTVCFRGGCLTGPGHAGAELHGFLAYLMKCAASGTPYTVFGYEGKQVRDNIHSSDLVDAFSAFYENPRVGEVYNIGGGRSSNCSMLEAIELCENITGRELQWSYEPENRVGDHIWWISDISRFQSHFPTWKLKYGVEDTLEEIFLTHRHEWEPRPVLK